MLFGLSSSESDVTTCLHSNSYWKHLIQGCKAAFSLRLLALQNLAVIVVDIILGKGTIKRQKKTGKLAYVYVD